MKLINNRLYFDYNASSPLAKSVKDHLARGDFQLNPSSLHTSGKKSKKVLLEATEKIQKIFTTKYTPVFHSGATEGINFVLQGRVQKLLETGKKPYLLAWASDHSAVLGTVKSLSQYPFQILPLEANGLYSEQVLKSVFKDNPNHHFILNLTWVNNETGVIQNLQRLREVCFGHSVFIHVDAAQTPNKIHNWNELTLDIDAYTFSAHKFGGLPGVGMTLLKEKSSILPLIHGGGQQEGLRSGTLNVLGVESLVLALEECLIVKEELTDTPRKYIEEVLQKNLGDKIIIVGKDAPRNTNTMDLIYRPLSSDQTLMHFDLGGMDISAGSACSSGRFESHVLSAMGFAAQKSHGLRFSFSPQMTLDDAKVYAQKILTLFQSL